MSNSSALAGNISLSDEMAPKRHVASAVFVGPAVLRAATNRSEDEEQKNDPARLS